MMRFILAFMLFFGAFTQASGQGGLDTLGLTGTMADTVVADRLFAEMKEFIKERKWEEAEMKGEQARVIYARIFGEESMQVSDVWHQKGLIGYVKGDNNFALENWEKALNIKLKLLGEEHPKVANLYYNLGVCCNSKGEFDKALEYNQRALNIRLKIFGEVHSDVADSYYSLGSTYNSKNEYDKAIDYYQKSLKIRLEIFGERHQDVSSLYNNLGVTSQLKGEYDKATEFFLKALKIQLEVMGEEHSYVAITYFNIGISYESNGEYDKALEYKKKALDIRLKLLGEQNSKVALSYNNIANTYNYKGDYNNALECIKKALKIQLKILEEEHPDLAVSYLILGVTYQSKGEYDKSIESFQKALKIRFKILGEKHPDVASLYNNLGITFELKREWDKAIEYYQKALNIQLEILGEDHPKVAGLYSNFAITYGSKGEYDKALEFDQKSINIRLKTLGEEAPDVASSYNNIGVTFKSIGEYDKALEYYQKALNIRLKILEEVHSDLASSYNNIGDYYRFREANEKAYFYYEKAIYASGYEGNNFSKVNSMQELFRTFRQLSLAQYENYTLTYSPQFLNQAIDYANQALAALNYQQSTLTEESSKSFHLSQHYPIYEQAISVSLLKADVDHNDTLRQNTFTYTEKSKAALLQAQIKAADALAFAGIPDSLLEQEYNLRIDITWREKQRQSLLDKGLTETDTNVLRISGIVFDLKQQYETLKKRFETEYPDYYRLKYDLSTVPLAYVQDTLLQKDQALLEYFTGDSSLFLFVVRPDTFLVQEVKRDFPLEAWIDSLRFGLYGYYTTDKSQRTDSLRDAALNSYIRYAQLLQQKLIAPVAAWLPEKVILVPDGPLGYIPFDALLSAEPEDRNNFKSYPYLLQKHQFSYTYSATLLREMRDKKHRREPQYDFAAFAPFYNGDTTLLAGMYAYDDLMRKDLQPLAFSGPEVAAAAKLMKGETIAGAAATEERFTSTAGNYRILHLATHGRADNRVGDYAFLAFNEIKDSIENELLYVKDLYNLQLNADLVVLSACETGIGKLQRGEGIISLARAFAYAGAKSIVTSLWSVNDKSTSELMRFFYRELRRGKDKDEALRLARQRLIREATVRNSHPFFWAAFVPLGDMSGVK